MRIIVEINDFQKDANDLFILKSNENVFTHSDGNEKFVLETGLWLVILSCPKLEF